MLYIKSTVYYIVLGHEHNSIVIVSSWQQCVDVYAY